MMADRSTFRPDESYSWKAYTRYRDGFLASSNAVSVMSQSRKFYAGDQYEEGLDPNIPKPVLNICFRYVESVSAKIVGTPWAIEFNTSGNNEDLSRMDWFYDYQMAQMDDKEFTTDMCHTALVDGVACAFTVYDADTHGDRGLYRGFLKRVIVPFEDVFFANPYCEDPQDQEYLGYVQMMPIPTVWQILEEYGDRSLKRLIVPDGWDWNTSEYNEDEIARKNVKVVTRYYRDEDGEVVFDLATRYCDLFKAHHYLNPRKNERELERIDAEKAGKRFDDYAMQPEKSTVQTPPEKQSDREYEEELGRFTRYPFSWYRPYPVKGKVLGSSVVTQLIPMQKVINFHLMMNAMSAQNHGMPKWAVLEGALADGEEINNDPSQVLRIKGKPGMVSIDSVIKRIEASATSGDMLKLAEEISALTQQVYGFDNLITDNLNDTSGYAMQQAQKQKNLVLEIPQQRLWHYLKDNARTDLLFFRHYVDHAKFYTQRDDGEMDRQNAFRSMSQNVGDTTGRPLPGADETGTLPGVNRNVPHDITRDDFMKDWEVSVEVTEGIAGSQIAESQHIQTVFQSFNTGNVDASVMRAEVESDPAISRHNRNVILNALTAMENSQLQQKQAEIDYLKQQLEQMAQQLQYYGQQIKQANERVKAYQQATVENAQRNNAITKGVLQSAQQSGSNQSSSSDVSEGEAKSMAARGYNGYTFGDSVQ